MQNNFVQCKTFTRECNFLRVNAKFIEETNFSERKLIFVSECKTFLGAQNLLKNTDFLGNAKHLHENKFLAVNVS